MLLLQNEINNIDYIIKKAAEKGMILAINPSPISDELVKMDLTSITYFILNEIEGNELTQETDPEKIARENASNLSRLRGGADLGQAGRHVL